MAADITSPLGTQEICCKRTKMYWFPSMCKEMKEMQHFFILWWICFTEKLVLLRSALILYCATIMSHVLHKHTPDLIDMVVPVSHLTGKCHPRSAQGGLFTYLNHRAFGSAISWPFFVQVAPKIMNFIFSSKMLNFAILFVFRRKGISCPLWLQKVKVMNPKSLSLYISKTVQGRQFKLIANSKLHIAIPMVTWMMTSHDPKKSRSWPQNLRLSISVTLWDRLSIKTDHLWETMYCKSTGYVNDDVLWLYVVNIMTPKSLRHCMFTPRQGSNRPCIGNHILWLHDVIGPEWWQFKVVSFVGNQQWLWNFS